MSGITRSEVDAAWNSAEYNAKRAEKAEARLARLQRAVDAFCEAECKLPMARWIHAPHYVKALFSLRTKPGKRGKA